MLRSLAGSSHLMLSTKDLEAKAGLTLAEPDGSVAGWMAQ